MKNSIPLEGYPYFPLKLKENCQRKVAFNPVDHQEYSFNPDALGVLELCDGRRSLDEIVDQITKGTGLGEQAIRSLVEELLYDLTLRGMLWWRREGIHLQPLPQPQQFYWDITQECNLRCAHCVVAAGSRDPQELNTSECLHLLNEARAMGIPSVIFSGGEPLMRQDFFQIASHAHHLGFGLAIATNGTLIDREVAMNFARMGFDVQISLDGSSADLHDRFRGRKGAYTDTIRGIEYLRTAKVPFTIGSVVNRLNLADFDNLFNLSISLGAKTFRLIPFIPFGRGKDSQHLEPTPPELKEVSYSLYQRRQGSPIPITDLEFEFSFNSQSCAYQSPSPAQLFGCSGGSLSFSVVANGEVLPCSFFIGVKAQSVRNHPLDWIWRHSPLLNYFRDIRAVDIQGECRTCGWFGVCLGGCPAANFSHGKMMQTNVHCWVAQKIGNSQSNFP